MHSRTILTLLALLFLSGCAGFGATTNIPTLLPADYIPTAIALTADALLTQAPQPTDNADNDVAIDDTQTETLIPLLAETNTTTPSPSPSPPPETVEEGQASPTSTPALSAQIPEADVQITNPGPLSKLVSPFTLIAYIVPGENRSAQVELWGEDGRLIYRRVFVFRSLNQQTSLATDISFETSGVAETARLVIQIKDDYDRVLSLTSENLILLASGETDLNSPGDLLSPIVIQQPEEKVLVQGNNIDVAGWVRMLAGRSLLVDLVAADGSVVGSRLAEVVSAPNGSHRSFSADVPFQVSAPTWVRVIVSERNGLFPGALQASSVEVLLSP